MKTEVTQIDADTGLQDGFLEAYAVAGKITTAAENAGVSRQSHYRWMAGDEAYRKRFRSLRYAVCQRIEDELVDRLINGWLEPVYQGGVHVGDKRKFDNAGAIAYLDRHDPDFQRGKRQNVDVTSNGETLPPIQFYIPDNGRNP